MLKSQFIFLFFQQYPILNYGARLFLTTYYLPIACSSVSHIITTQATTGIVIIGYECVTKVCVNEGSELSPLPHLSKNIMVHLVRKKKFDSYYSYIPFSCSYPFLVNNEKSSMSILYITVCSQDQSFYGPNQMPQEQSCLLIYMPTMSIYKAGLPLKLHSRGQVQEHVLFLVLHLSAVHSFPPSPTSFPVSELVEEKVFTEMWNGRRLSFLVHAYHVHPYHYASISYMNGADT